uniref:Tetratricopeptide repeat protein n=1 Tax=Streptomyces sp. NBC_00049 TaxID=2903617 RepID=A0AAU2JX88_9ACTN
MITTARLAELHAENGSLDQAISVWHSFADEYPHLNSRRVSAALASMRARLRAHSTYPPARGLLARAAVMTPIRTS